MTKDEHDAITTARQLNSIPLALAEFSADFFRVLFYNSAFEETAELNLAKSITICYIG